MTRATWLAHATRRIQWHGFTWHHLHTWGMLAVGDDLRGDARTWSGEKTCPSFFLKLFFGSVFFRSRGVGWPRFVGYKWSEMGKWPKINGYPSSFVWASFQCFSILTKKLRQQNCRQIIPTTFLGVFFPPKTLVFNFPSGLISSTSFSEKKHWVFMADGRTFFGKGFQGNRFVLWSEFPSCQSVKYLSG